MESGKLGPEFNEKLHPEAIFTSRPLRSLISKSSSFSINSFDSKQGTVKTQYTDASGLGKKYRYIEISVLIYY